MSSSNEPTDFSEYSLEDLEQAKQQTSTTPRDQQKQCPECKAVSINRRGTGISSKVDHRFRCKKCGWTGNQPEDADAVHPNAEEMDNLDNLGEYACTHHSNVDGEEVDG